MTEKYRLNVMISSTIVNLPSYRDAAREAVLKCGMFPQMMEMESALQINSTEFSIKLVDNSDIYVGVFAQKYGSIPEEKDISMTEIEYQRAIDRKIPILIFIIDDDFAIPVKPSDIASFFEEDPAKKIKLANLKTELRKRHVVASFTTPKDLLAKIFQALVQTKNALSSIDIVTPSAEADLDDISNILLQRSGNRRTAYPTDMNFRDLYDYNVFISPSFSHTYQADSQLLPFRKLLSNLVNGSNTIIVGEPGSGKSFLSYLVHRNLIDNPSLICLPIDLRLLLDAIKENSFLIDRNNLLNLLSKSYKGTSLGQFNSGDGSFNSRKLFFIVDGIDELTSNQAHVKTLPLLLEKLNTLGNILVTSRTQDFVLIFAPILDLSVFQSILKVKEWDFEDFTQFVNKLVEANKLANNQILEIVKNSDTLKSLIKRPLLSRMLIFISETDLKKIHSSATLYSIYLGKYATIIDSYLIKETCISSPTTYQIWREISWYIFQEELFIHDKLPRDVLYEFVHKSGKVRQECIDRHFESMFNLVILYQTSYLQYIHYSFFEFLVADYVANQLISAFSQRINNIFHLLKKDLTPAMRHYLKEIIRKRKSKGFSKWLIETYLSNEKNATKHTDCLIANNLVIYIMGRLGDDTSNELIELLEMEKNEFLIKSIYWALASIKGTDTTKEFIKILVSNDTIRKMNRGYHLYYYGDLDGLQDPPYMDDNPGRGWDNTKQIMLTFMADSEYRQKATGRRILDLFTFLDLALSRNEKLQINVINELKLLLSYIQTDTNDPNTVLIIDEMIKRVMSS